MAVYRVISLDLRTGTRVAEIELANLKYGQRLNSAGPLSGDVILPQPDGDRLGEAAAILSATLNDAVSENRRHLIVERDGVIVGDGIVWAAPDRDDGIGRSVTASSTWSYFWHRRIKDRLEFAAVDQLAIARSLVSYAITQPAGSVGVSLNAELCGITRDRTYEAFEFKEVGESVEQLAAVENGFDFAIDCYWDPATGAIVKRFNVHYPRRGRTFAQTGHVFELGRNIVKFQWPSDGTTTANTVYGVGAGEGDSMLRTTAVDAYQFQALTSGGPGYPLLEDVLSNKDVSDLATLQAQARARLLRVSQPIVVPKVTVRADMDPVLGSYITGDACRIIIPPRMSPRFPDGLDTYRRIIGWDVTVDDQGGESVELLLGEEPSA